MFSDHNRMKLKINTRKKFGQRTYHVLFLSILNLLKFILWPTILPTLENVPYILEENTHSAVVECTVF